MQRKQGGKTPSYSASSVSGASISLRLHVGKATSVPGGQAPAILDLADLFFFNQMHSSFAPVLCAIVDVIIAEKRLTIWSVKPRSPDTYERGMRLRTVCLCMPGSEKNGTRNMSGDRHNDHHGSCSAHAASPWRKMICCTRSVG